MVTVCLNLAKIDEEWQQVTDRHKIKLLNKIYKFDTIKTDRKNPLIFGSFSNWKVFEMMVPFHYAASIGCESEQERKVVKDYLIDSDICKLKEDFRHFEQTVIKLIQN